MNTKLSESEEMYLSTIARLQEFELPGPAPLSQLAEELAVLPVSANQMIRKLRDAGLVTYTPYKGVNLTDKGATEAKRILRHRRLWEVFLFKNLGYSPEESDKLACRLEHTLPPEAAERLAGFLGNPALSPSNRPIPAAQSGDIHPGILPLNQLGLNTSAQVVEINVDAVACNFLDLQDLRYGSHVILVASTEDGDSLVQTEAGRKIQLTADLARLILVMVD